MSSKATTAEEWSRRLYAGGWNAGSAGAIEVIEPATGHVLVTVGRSSKSDVAKAGQAALAGQQEWVAMPPRERAAIFRKAAMVLERDFEEIARFLTRETGSIRGKAHLEIRESIAILYAASAMPLAPQGQVLPQISGRLNFARRMPLGVIGVISPFNFPLLLSMRSVAPALAAGNAVLLKPDPQTPVSGGFFISNAFEEAGLPKSILHVLQGGADVGEALCSEPTISMIAFTGSTVAGRKVGEACGRHLKKVSLELGGKNPLLVLEDADIEVAASNAAWGSYLHQGQICMATGKILVHSSIAEELISRLTAKAKAMIVGDPAREDVAIGPVINQKQRDHIHGIVQDSVAAGARLDIGGTFSELFYQPTVLSDVRPGMRAFEEEIFGPVGVVVSFDSDEEAINLANRSEYGLSAGVIGGSFSHAMDVGLRLKVGLLHVNDQTVNDDGVNPFGGRGLSGNGSSMGGPADWEEYTQWQWVTLKGTATLYPI